jgi:transposase
LAGILFVRCTGTPWSYLTSELACGSGSTCWRRLRDWQAAGVWRRLERTGAWFNRFRRLRVRDERRADIHAAFVALATALILLNCVARY